ncbi:MAG: HEAT repeat domain-containing protein [Phycisphaerae bacterium]|nr:HEAT repeat domain-containing protein [Phycisphaerae bacterium]
MVLPRRTASGSAPTKIRGARRWSRPWILARVLVYPLCLPCLSLAAEPPATQPVATAPASAPSSVVDVAAEIVKVVGQSDSPTRRAAAINVLRSTTGDGAKALVTVFTTENNEAAKLAVCEAIAEVKAQAPDFIPHLEQLLHHPDAALQKAAAAALAGYADPEVREKLDAYRREQERRLLVESVQRLMDTLYDATRGEPERTDLLQTWLKSDLPMMRTKALEIIHEALRRGGTKPSAAVLDHIRTLDNDPSPTVRQALVAFLRDQGLLDDAPRIREMLSREPAESVREEIYKALGKLIDADSIPLCMAGLGDPSEQVAAAAADALGHLCEKGTGKPPEKLADVVRSLLQRVEQPVTTLRLRTDLVEAMADIAAPAFGSVLVRYAGPDEPESSVRQAAIRGLGRIGNADHLPVALDRLAQDNNAGVREVSAEAIGRLGAQPAHLQALLSRLDPKLEPAAAVQNQAWRAYQLVFQRLSDAEQEAALAVWMDSDLKTLGRKIELLTGLEAQVSVRHPGGDRLMALREQLGDACLAAGQTDEATAAWSRALGLAPADDVPTQTRLAGKLVSAYLKNGSPDKAITQAATAKLPEVRAAGAALLLQFVQDLGATDAEAAAGFLDRLLAAVPDGFGPDWAAKFKAARPAPPPHTQSAPAAANTQPAEG